MRPRSTAALAAVLATCAACAPILPPPVPSSPVPGEGAMESPSPGVVWSEFTAIPAAELDALRETGLLIPVLGVALDRIQDSFDAARDGGRRHDAVDILAPRGTPVISATDGTVLRVGTNTLGGNTVWVAGADPRFVFYYAHLDRYANGMHAGARVARGTTIGFVGTSGNAPPQTPHLHFQVMRITDTTRWWTGTPVNPFPYLVEPRAAEQGKARWR